MTGYSYVPYNSILEKLHMEYEFTRGQYSDDYMRQMIYDGLAITDSRYMMETKSVFKEVTGSTAKLPEDMLLMVTTALSCYSTLEEAECHPNEVIPMKWNTDNLDRSFCFLPIDNYVDSPNRYSINKGSIVTNFPSGIVRIVYKRVPLDDNGDPMIPADESWQRYMIHEIALKIAKNLFFMDKLTGDKLRFLQGERDWYLSQASNKAKMSDKPMKDSWKNEFIRSIRDLYPENTFMSTLADREVRRWHGRSDERGTRR
jgi:hypothetical protein